MYGGGYYYESPSLRAIAVVKTTDGWSHGWTITPLISCSGYVYAIAVNPSDPGIVYAGGQYFDRNGNWYVGLFKSTNGGTDWFDISAGVDDESQPVYALAIDPDSSGTIYAGTSGGIYRSTSGGSSWTDINCGFDTVYALSIDLSSPNILYAGTPNGVYRSTDMGLTWFTVTQGLLPFDITSLAIDSIPANRVYVGTRGAGVFAQNVIAVEEIGATLAQNCPILYESFPNPFSKICTIRYSLPASSQVSLRVYNLAGRRVRELTDGSKQAGLHIVNWDGKDDGGRLVPSNIYFYRLRGKEFSATGKMLFMR